MKRALHLAAIACLLAFASATISARSPSLKTPSGTSTPRCVLDLMSEQTHDLTARSATCPLVRRSRAVKFDIVDHAKQDDEHSPAVRMRRRLLVGTRHGQRERQRATRIIPRQLLRHRTAMLRRSWTHHRQPGAPPRGH